MEVELPLISPVLGFRLSPVGRPVAEKLVGLFSPSIVYIKELLVSAYTYAISLALRLTR